MLPSSITSGAVPAAIDVTILSNPVAHESCTISNSISGFAFSKSALTCWDRLSSIMNCQTDILVFPNDKSVNPTSINTNNTFLLILKTSSFCELDEMCN